MALPGRPGTNLVLANLIGGPKRDRRGVGNAMLARAAELGPIVAAVEADDCTPAEVLDPEVWAWSRRGDKLQDGTLWAWRREVADLRSASWTYGCPAGEHNAERSIHRVQLRVWNFPESFTLDAALGHVPWGDTGVRRVMFRHLRETGADLILGDMNSPRARVRAAFPDRQLRGSEVMWLAARRGRLELGATREVDALPRSGADDHPLVRAHVRPS